MENKLNQGRYIVIEGTDGAGTTTQKDLLIKYLQEIGRNVIGVIQPGGTVIGQHLRKIFKDKDLERSVESNVDIATIDRRELAIQVIRPHILKGFDVVGDRDWYSTIAYQGFGEGYDIDDIVIRSQKAMAEFAKPDLGVIIDVPVELAEARMKQRGGQAASDFFESKGRDFFEKVRQGYLYAADRFNLHIIDGAADKQTVHDEIVSLLS